ncbi:MAG TPA: hypothetical protein VG797_10250 [Phycisphaerales bacterium]|nr:hypothetical protein [Phycisphaerales bacterium]
MSRSGGVIIIIHIVMLALLSTVFACTESRVVAGGGGLKSLPGAKGGVWRPGETNVEGESWESLLEKQEKYRQQQIAKSGDDKSAPKTLSNLRIQNPDGSVTLVSRAPSHALQHLVNTLQNGEYDLLYHQVLSDATKRAYAREGKDSWEAVDELIARFDDIRDLYSTVPLGERTPGVYLENIGPSQFRLRSGQADALGLKLKAFDFIVEDGKFRILAVR